MADNIIKPDLSTTNLDKPLEQIIAEEAEEQQEIAEKEAKVKQEAEKAKEEAENNGHKTITEEKEFEIKNIEIPQSEEPELEYDDDIFQDSEMPMNNIEIPPEVIAAHKTADKEEMEETKTKMRVKVPIATKTEPQNDVTASPKEEEENPINKTQEKEEELDTKGLSYIFAKDEKGRNVLKLLRQCSADEILNPEKYCGNDKDLVRNIKNKLKDVDVIEIGDSEQPDIKFDVYSDLMSAIRTVNTSDRLVGVNFVGDNINFHDCQITDCLATIHSKNEKENANKAFNAQLNQLNAMEKVLFDWENSNEFIEYTTKAENLSAEMAMETNDIAKVSAAGAALFPFLKAEYQDQITNALNDNEEYNNILTELKKQGLVEDEKVSLLSDKERIENQITGILVKKFKDEIKPEILFEDSTNASCLKAVKKLEDAENFQPRNIEERYSKLEPLKKAVEEKFKELNKDGALGNIENITIENVLKRAKRLRAEIEKNLSINDKIQKAPIAYEMSFMCSNAPVCGKNDREVGFCEKSHGPIFVSILGNKDKGVVNTGEFFLSDANIFGLYVDPKIELALGKGAMARGDIRGLAKMMKEHEGDPKYISDHCADYLKGADYQNNADLRKYALDLISKNLNIAIQEAKKQRDSFDSKIIAEQIKEMKSLEVFLKDFDTLTKDAKKPIEKEKVVAQVALMKKAAESYTSIYTKDKNLKLIELLNTIPDKNQKLEQTSSDKLRKVLNQVLAVRSEYEKESWIIRGKNIDDPKYLNNLEFRGYMNNDTYLADEKAKAEFKAISTEPLIDNINPNNFHFDMKPSIANVNTQITAKMTQPEGSKQQQLDIISSLESPLDFSIYDNEGKELITQKVRDILQAKYNEFVTIDAVRASEILQILDSSRVFTDAEELKNFEEFKKQALKQIKDAAKYIPENYKDLNKCVVKNDNNTSILALENYKYCKSAIVKLSNEKDSKEIIKELNKRENDIEKAESKYNNLKDDESILNVINGINNQIRDMEATANHTKDMLTKETYTKLSDTTIMECDSAGCTADVGAMAGQNLFKLRTKKINMDESISNVYQQKGQLVKNINAGSLFLLDKIRNKELSLKEEDTINKDSILEFAKTIAETSLTEFVTTNKKINSSEYGRINKEIKKYEKAVKDFIAKNKGANKEDIKTVLNTITNGNNDLEWDVKIERFKLAEYLDRMEDVSKDYKGKTVAEYKKGACFEDAAFLNTTSNIDGIAVKSNTDEYFIQRKEIENTKSEADAIVKKLATLTNVSILSIRNAEDVENLKKTADKYRDEIKKELTEKKADFEKAKTILENYSKNNKFKTVEFENTKNEKNRLDREIQKMEDDINNINLLLYKKEPGKERFKDDSLNKSEIEKAIDGYRNYAFFAQYNSSETQYDINHNGHALTLEKERAELVKALGGKANMKNGRAEIIEEPIRTEQNKEKYDRLVKIESDLKQIWSDGGKPTVGNFAQPSGLKDGASATVIGNVKFSKFAINGKFVKQYSDGVYKVLDSQDKSLKKLEAAHKYYMAVGGMKAIASTMAQQTISSIEHFTVTRAMAFAVIAIAMATGKTITWATKKALNDIRKDSLSKNGALLAMANIMKDPKYTNMTPDKMLSTMKDQGLVDFATEKDRIIVKVREIPDVPNEVKKVLNNTIARKGFTTYSFSKEDILKLIDDPEYQSALAFSFARKNDKVEKYEEHRKQFWSGLKDYADKRNMVDNNPSQILGGEKATVLEKPIIVKPETLDNKVVDVSEKTKEKVKDVTPKEKTEVEKEKIKEKLVTTPELTKESVITESEKDIKNKKPIVKNEKEKANTETEKKAKIDLDPKKELEKEVKTTVKVVQKDVKDKTTEALKNAKNVEPQPVTVKSSKADLKKAKAKKQQTQNLLKGSNKNKGKNSPRGSNNRGKIPKGAGGRDRNGQ